MELSNPSDKEFKVMVIKMLTRLERRVARHSENLNKQIENIKKNQLKMNNKINEMKIRRCRRTYW